jgi:DNA modification methylase
MWFIRLFTQAGDVVLDPFIGSGTTAVACIRAGRRFLGIEVNDEYYQLARDAVASEKGQLGLEST